MHVLVAHGDQLTAALIARRLRAQSVTVDVAVDGAMVKALCAMTRYDVLLLADELPGPPVRQIAAELGGPAGGVRVVVVSASSEAGGALGRRDVETVSDADADAIVRRVMGASG